MTIDRWLLLLVVVVASVLAVGAAVWCGGAKQDEKVTLDQVPAAVKATIVKAAKAGKIEAIERETKDAKTVYEAELILDGKTVEVRVAPDGKLLGTEAGDEHEAERETEETLTLDQLPAAVKATIVKAAEGGTIQEIDKVTADGKTVYEADVLIGGEKFEVQVAPDGKLLSKAVDDEGEGDEAEEGGKAKVRVRRFHFPQNLCRACPRYAECVTDPRGRGRTITLHPDEERL